MINRPLFDAPLTTAKPSRKTKRLSKPAAKVPREHWRITVVPTGDGPPATIRIRRMLKTAVRGHRLKAVRVECLGIPATPGNPTGNLSSDGQRGSQTAFNAAKTARLIALRDKIATLAASLHENQ